MPDRPATTVRFAGRDDAEALARLRTLWRGEEEAGFQARLADWLRAEGDRRTVWLVEQDGAAIGMTTMLEYRRMPWPGEADSRWGYLGHMFVRDECRGRGIGSALLAAVIALADERRYARLVLSPSADALSFYRNRGFALADGDAGEVLLARSGARRAGPGPATGSP